MDFESFAFINYLQYRLPAILRIMMHAVDFSVHICFEFSIPQPNLKQIIVSFIQLII